MAYFTGDDVVRRESLLDLIRDVSPASSNYLVEQLAVSEAKNTLHEWPIYNIARPTSTSFKAEGADADDPLLTGPSRSQNITAIVTQVVRVSGTEMAINSAGQGDKLTWQKKNALTRLKAQMEFNLLNGAGLVSGSTGVARTMAGINAVISTNLTARNSGTSMSTTELEDIMQNSWDAVGLQDYVAKVLLVPMQIKRKISTFTTRVTPYAENTETIYNNIGFYESSSGMVKVIPHKDVISGSGTTHVYALNDNMFRMAFLTGRQPFWKPLASIGDSERGEYITELTLESLAERCSVKRFGYATAG